MTNQHNVRFDRVEVRPGERRLFVDAREAALGARAFDVLLALIERRERLVPKSELMNVAWPDTIVEENNLQVQISTLRKVLGHAAIKTVPGRGYQFTLASSDDVPPALAPTPDAVSAARRPAAKTNVPGAVEGLIGRDADVEATGVLLAAHRLVTVLGPGGIGKTRVALEVARAQLGKHPHGTWWVDLASTAAPERIAGTIADAAGMQLGEGDAAAKLASSLAHLELLLVLDNCEHVADGAARVAQDILERAPGVTILATSQVPLKIGAEHVYRLGTLDMPAAVELLERRAQAADRRFTIAPSNLATATAICQTLEGVALAIEMAAARVPWMGIDAVHARLGDRFRLLSGSSRVAPGRHRTLLATLDWSHALLSRDEQAVLRRIGAFTASFDMDSAKALAQDASLDEWAVLDALGGLVDKSLLQVDGLDPPRYRLLETTRLYALDRLAESGEIAGVRARHATVMAALAVRALTDSWTATDAQWSARYGADYQDLQVAFAHAVAHRDAEAAGEIAYALRTMDSRRGNVSGLRARMHACFTLLADATGRDAARLWDGVVPSDQIAIDAIARLEAGRSRLAAWRTQADPQRLYVALCGWADELARSGDFEGAEQTLQEAQVLEHSEWPLRLRMTLPLERGAVAMYAKDAAGYRLHRGDVLRLAEQAGATRTATSARLGLGDAALLALDYAEAATLCRAVVDELRDDNRVFARGIALENLANALVHLGDLEGAAAAAAESLPIMRRNEAGSDVFTILALVAIRAGLADTAARMLGHVDAWVEKSQYALAPNEARAADEAGKEIDDAIGAEQHARVRRQGALLTDAEADALAAACFAQLGGRDDFHP